MDAQQRHLLESAYEVLNQTESAIGSTARTAVMVGIGTVDYISMSVHLGNGIYVASGALTKIHVGRFSTPLQLKFWPADIVK